MTAGLITNWKRCGPAPRRFLFAALVGSGLVPSATAHGQVGSVVDLARRSEHLFDQENTADVISFLDSIRSVASPDPSVKLLVNTIEAHLIRFEGHPLRAFALLDTVAPFVEKAPDLLRLLFKLEHARVLKDLNLYDRGLLDAHSAIDLARTRKEERLLAASLLARVELERRLGRYDDMLADLIEADKLCQRIGYDRAQCNVLINWGNMFYYQKRYAEALTKYEASYNCAVGQRMWGMARNCIQNIGSVTLLLQGRSKALAVYERALKESREAGDKGFEAAQLSSIALIYNDSGQFGLARANLDRSMQLVRDIGDTSGLVSQYLYLATNHWRQHEPDSALIAVNTAAALSRAIRSIEDEARAERKLYDYLKTLGREREALAHFERYVALSDSLDRVKQGELINRLEIGFETEKKERTIEVQQLQLAQETSKARAKEIQRNILLGTLAAMLIIGFLTYRNVNHKRALAEQHQRLSEHRVEQLLLDQELRLVKATMEGQDMERQRVARDLHDRVGGMLSGVKLQFSALDERVSNLFSSGPEQFKKALDLLDTAVGEVRRISHDLLSSNLAAFGLQAALSDLRDAVHVPGAMDVELVLFGLEGRLAKEVEVATFHIVQEAVSNTLKHARATTLSIQVARIEDRINILVEDNGRGFAPGGAKGMGMDNLVARATQLAGTVNVDSMPGRGTSISVDLPLK